MKQLLRKAGDKIRNFDDAYSAKIAKMYPDTPAGAMGKLFGGGMPSTRPAEITSAEPGAIDNVMSYALPVINAVPKYALPAAGVTLAGKGLYDIGVALTSVSDQQTEGTMPL